MATVAELVRGGNDLRAKFIDWTSTYHDNNKEFLRGDMWEFKFLNVPKIVYYPGDDIINARLNSVNVGIDYSVGGIEKRMRGGWNIYQRTSQNTNGTLTLSLVDKEDQALTDCQLFITNSSRIDVRILTFYNVIIQDGQIDEIGALESESDRADITLTMQFEHYSREFKNL